MNIINNKVKYFKCILEYYNVNCLKAVGLEPTRNNFIKT